MAKSQNFTLAQPAEVDVVVDAQKARVDPALAKFDSLPDAAHVRLPVVLALYACSRATAWRHVRTHHCMECGSAAQALDEDELRSIAKVRFICAFSVCAADVT